MKLMFRDCDALPPGRWVQRKGVHYFEPDQPALVFDAEPWPAIKLCAVCDTAHRRDESCPTCLAWAERDAQLWAWRQARFANRHIIWTILDARKSVAA